MVSPAKSNADAATTQNNTETNKPSVSNATAQPPPTPATGDYAQWDREGVLWLRMAQAGGKDEFILNQLKLSAAPYTPYHLLVLRTVLTNSPDDWFQLQAALRLYHDGHEDGRQWLLKSLGKSERVMVQSRIGRTLAANREIDALPGICAALQKGDDIAKAILRYMPGWKSSEIESALKQGLINSGNYVGYSECLALMGDQTALTRMRGFLSQDQTKSYTEGSALAVLARVGKINSQEYEQGLAKVDGIAAIRNSLRLAGPEATREPSGKFLTRYAEEQVRYARELMVYHAARDQENQPSPMPKVKTFDANLADIALQCVTLAGDSQDISYLKELRKLLEAFRFYPRANRTSAGVDG